MAILVVGCVVKVQSSYAALTFLSELRLCYNLQRNLFQIVISIGKMTMVTIQCPLLLLCAKSLLLSHKIDRRKKHQVYCPCSFFCFSEVFHLVFAYLILKNPIQPYIFLSILFFTDGLVNVAKKEVGKVVRDTHLFDLVCGR